MRRLTGCRWSRFSFARTITTNWTPSIPPLSDPRWRGVGKAVVEQAETRDTGRNAFLECCTAREQLECVIQSIGYDMNVYIFGGLVTLGIFEVGGDVDFVGVSDIEPGFEEAGEIVNRSSRELRRLGLRTWALPRARVPVVKADRVSRSLPGSPFHSLSCDGIFQFARQVNLWEAESFEKCLRDSYGCTGLEWNSSHQFATVQFGSTSSLVYALTQIKRHENVEIPLRLPVDVRNGPEIYRFPFDFCLNATGLRNSYLLGEALSQYAYARHLLLVLKQWGRSSGILNSFDGLLASYALTVMVVHFLIRVGVIPRVSSLRIAEEPQQLQMNPDYRPLAGIEGCCLEEVGYLFGLFFEYYGSVFNYENSVVCTTNLSLTKQAMHWDTASVTPTTRPPFFEFAIKDPYGLDNIGRNLDHDATVFVQQAHHLAFKALMKDIDDPVFAVNNLIKEPPRPPRKTMSLRERGIQSSLSPEQLEARHALSKMEFYERKRSMERMGRKTVRNSENQNRAANVTKNVLGWIRSDEHH